MSDWELHGPDGTVIKLIDVRFARNAVDVADCDDPNAPLRREHGPWRVLATVVDGMDDGPQVMGR